MIDIPNSDESSYHYENVVKAANNVDPIEVELMSLNRALAGRYFTLQEEDMDLSRETESQIRLRYQRALENIPKNQSVLTEPIDLEIVIDKSTKMCWLWITIVPATQQAPSLSSSAITIDKLIPTIDDWLHKIVNLNSNDTTRSNISPVCDNQRFLEPLSHDLLLSDGIRNKLNALLVCNSKADALLIAAEIEEKVESENVGIRNRIKQFVRDYLATGNTNPVKQLPL